MTREQLNQMMTDGTMVKALRSILDEEPYGMDWTEIGLRVQDGPAHRGYCRLSREWVDGFETSRALPGSCALRIASTAHYIDDDELEASLKRAVSLSNSYFGDDLYIVVGERVDDYADEYRIVDEGEVVIGTPTQTRRRGARAVDADELLAMCH